MLTATLLLTSLVGPFAGLSAAAVAPAPAGESAEPAPILEIAAQAGAFNTLAAALQAAGLVDALSGEGPFTVFAPTDEAFAKLPDGTVESLLRPENREQLVSVLTYHVVPGRVEAVDALSAGRAATLQGDELAFRLEGGTLRVGESLVLNNDIAASNGVIHVIDSVLLPPAPEPPPRLGPGELMLLAIDRGVPLYNNGQRAACAAVYEMACRAVVDLGGDEVPESTRALLTAALAEALRSDDAGTRAWTLRLAMDESLATLAAAGSDDRRPRARAETASYQERVVFGFDDDSGRWPAVNDDVMGGISRGSCRLTQEGTALFLGALSLENNGGFSTIRSRSTDLGLAGWDGLVIRVRGDGRSYKLSALPSDRRGELHYWEQPFDTEPDEWMELRVAFDDLTHRVMGWQMDDGPLDPGTIRSLAFGISDKDTRPFALEVDWIKAYRGAAPLAAADSDGWDGGTR